MVPLSSYFLMLIKNFLYLNTAMLAFTAEIRDLFFLKRKPLI
jgi:hypothetical protein